MQTIHHKALITGGANGIGQAITTHFASQGINVIVADIDETQGVAMAQNHQNITFIKANMAMEDDILAIFKQHPDIDIVINNVGISKFKPLLELSVYEWDTILQHESPVSIYLRTRNGKSASIKQLRTNYQYRINASFDVGTRC